MREILYQNEPIIIDDCAKENVLKSRKVVERIVEDGHIVYGINTGFGKFSDVNINESDVHALQLHLIRSHACGIGEPFEEIVSRAMVVLRLNALLKGFSGIRLEVLDRLTYMVNHHIHPV